MRSLIVACLALSATGCNSWSLNSDLNGAYRAPTTKAIAHR